VAIQLNSGAEWLHNRREIAALLAELPAERPCLVLCRKILPAWAL